MSYSNSIYELFNEHFKCFCHYTSEDILTNLGSTIFIRLVSIHTHANAWDQKHKLMRILKFKFSELWSANSYHVKTYDQ